MATTGCDEHGVALAESPKGEATREPEAGLMTLTLANAVAAHKGSARKREEDKFMKKCPL